MKKQTAVAIVMMVAMVSMAAASQSTTKNIEAAGKNYVIGMRSGNQGLAESSLMQIAKIKMRYPRADFADAKHVIDSLAVNSTSPSVRYKAYLTSNVCDDPKWFAMKDHAAYADNDEFFSSVWSHMQERALGSRAN